MTQLTTYNAISIAEIVFYSFILVSSIWLCKKHGIARGSGWRFLAALALTRIVGSSLQLATISYPTTLGLYIGWQVCNGIGIGPLILLCTGLLGRVFDAIKASNGRELIPKRVRRGGDLLMTIGLILFIVGGVEASFVITNGTVTVAYAVESKIGTVIIIVVLVLLVLELLVAAANLSSIPKGEKRLIVAVAISVPFLVVRTAYTCLLIFETTTKSVWLFLGTSVIMEMIVCLVCVCVGLTLAQHKWQPSQKETPEQQEQQMPLRV